jgi:hypothetical protein
MQVTGTHPETYSVDVEDWRSGWKMKGVPVMTGPATARTGVADLPVFTEKEPGIAIVDTIDGAPIVLGFLHTRVSQMKFMDGRTIMRHDSDVYLSIGRDGETELRHPSGAMIRIGVSTEHEDLTGDDFDKIWATPRNTGKDVKIALEIGTAKVTMSSDDMVLTVGATSITLTAAGVAIASTALTHNGTNVGDTHVHGGIIPGGGNTSVPA